MDTVQPEAPEPVEPAKFDWTAAGTVRDWANFVWARLEPWWPLAASLAIVAYIFYRNWPPPT